jgi:AcrR family transcriptional regulator
LYEVTGHTAFMTAKRPRRTAERILDVTLAMFNRFGEPNVSTSQLCGELGISPGNLFYHHPTRDALVAGLFVRYQTALDQALAVPMPTPITADIPAQADAAATTPPWWQGTSSEPLTNLIHLAETIAHVAWVYRFLFRDLSDLVSRHRVLEEGLPPLLRRQARALMQALRTLPWHAPAPDDAALATWAGHMLAALTGSTGLDGALDPREHLRQSGPHAVDVALGRALGLLRPALSGPDRTLMDTHLGPGDPFGMDPWWLASPGG